MMMINNKAIITKIGYMDENNQPQDFVFNCNYKPIPVINIKETGEIIYAGYSVEELKEISKSTSKYYN